MKMPGVGRPHPRIATTVPGTRRASFHFGEQIRRGATSKAPLVGQPISLVLYTTCFVLPSKAMPHEYLITQPSPSPSNTESLLMR